MAKIDVHKTYIPCSSGQEVQRISVIQSLPKLLHDNSADALRRVVPRVKVSQVMIFF